MRYIMKLYSRLYDKGHFVVGLDIAEPAAKFFYENHKIPYDVSTIEGFGVAYKSKDGRMNFYVGDIFIVTRYILTI